MPNAFVDSNVVIYAADESFPQPRNTSIARELLRQRDLWISVQVLNEFTVNARRQDKLGFSPEQERQWYERLLLFNIVPLTTDTFLTALTIHARHQISHWDSLILASVRDAGCETLYTEDLNDGQVYDGVQVINPFR
jgi:predicted nucleic acid-binding protein